MKKLPTIVKFGNISMDNEGIIIIEGFTLNFEKGLSDTARTDMIEAILNFLNEKCTNAKSSIHSDNNETAP